MLAQGSTRCALLGLSFLSCLCTATDTSDSPITYHATVSEVRVAFFATDENNRPVGTVRKEDFAVVDNEIVVRDFRSFMHSDETALDVLLAVDVSESVAPRVRVVVGDVLQLVAQKQSVADDNISILSFNGTRPALICSSDCHNSAAATRLQAVKNGGVTPLFDTLVYAAKFLAHRRGPGVRPVLILFSDGVDTMSLSTARDAVTAILASGALVYSVDLSGGENRSGGSALLKRLSETSGGRYFLRGGAANVLKTVLEDLHASYVVTYSLPSHAEGFHSLHLLPTHNLNLRFHSRNSYYYENSTR